MPLFGNKFSPKKPSPRKSVSLSSLTKTLDKESATKEFGLAPVLPISLNLNGNRVTFEDGQWSSETSGGASSKEVAKLKKQNSVLVEENNMLKYKIEILFDLLAESTAEKNLQDRDINELKKALSSKGGKGK